MVMFLPPGYGFYYFQADRNQNIIRTYGDYIAARVFRTSQIERDNDVMERLKILNRNKNGRLHQYVGDSLLERRRLREPDVKW